MPVSLFTDALKEHFKNTPDRIALRDESGRAITYGELDLLSAKCFAYLEKKGIGKGQPVMILLPRSALIPAAMIGVFRFGASFTVLEDDAPQDRIDYIRNDCGCVLTVDRAVWQEIEATQPVFGWTDADEHDTLLAVYTSGTTGAPKGVLLERGVLELNVLNAIVAEKAGAFCRGDDFVLSFPLNFIAAIIAFEFLYLGSSISIISYRTAKDPAEFIKYLHKTRPQIIFLIPSAYSALESSLPPFIRTVLMGGELAGDIPEGRDRYIVNAYSTSEIGYVCAHNISYGGKKAMPLTDKTVNDAIAILDENGAPAAKGCLGEICVRTPYTRGYIGLPGETQRCFRNGYFITGDVGYTDENGSIVCCGRADDMIKINGNRVEPEETANAFRRATGITESCAKGFSDGKRSYICVYYSSAEPVRSEEVLAEMAKALPYYMLPTAFVKMDALPRVANGKTDKTKLAPPDTASGHRLYLAPVGEEEKALCRAFSEVLGTERTGVLDDFISLGGDSLSAIRIVMSADLDFLSTADLYECGSIRAIALRVRQKQEEAQSEPRRSPTDPYPLTPAQEYCLKWQLRMPFSTMYNLPVLLSFDKPLYDADRLAAALEKSITAHPALLTVIYPENGGYLQRCEPSFLSGIIPEKCTEEELDAIKPGLVQPFEMLGKPLYRARIFETAKAIYLFFDVSHVVFDGGSVPALFADLFDHYFTGHSQRQDNYFDYLALCESRANTAHYRERLEYFKRSFNSSGYCVFPEKDSDNAEKTPERLTLPLDGISHEVRSFSAGFKTTLNAFFVFISLLSVSFYSNRPKVMICWLYNNRTEKRWKDSAGLFNVELPVKLDISSDKTLSELLSSVNVQISEGIASSECNYGYIDEAEMLTFIYQKDLFTNSGLIREGVQCVDLPEPLKRADNDFSIEVIDEPDEFSLCLTYDSGEYTRKSAERFADIFYRLAKITANAEPCTVTVREVFDALRTKP